MNRTQMIEKMAEGDQETRGALESVGQFGVAVEHGSGVDADVAALPAIGMAVMVLNDAPVWFSATSLEDALEAVESGDYANRTQ